MSLKEAKEAMRIKFQCPTCNHGAKTEERMLEHIIEEHNHEDCVNRPYVKRDIDWTIDVYQCDKCFFLCKSKSGLAAHMRSKHGKSTGTESP